VRRQKLKNHAKLLRYLKNKLTNPNFISTYRTSPEYFTRNRSFTFKSLSLFIISTIQSSIQRELDRFFRTFNNQLLADKFVSQSAFSQARLKIRPEAFEELRQGITKIFYTNYAVKKWMGLRLIAIDGSELMLPKNKDTIEKFGEYTTNFMNKTIVLARISKAYDVLNKINIDAKLVNRKIGEHRLANQHLEHCGASDLLLMDRGYPSFDLFMKILARGSGFCARVTVSTWSVAKELVNSGQKEIVVDILPGNDLKRMYKKQGQAIEPIKCRFVCIELPSGEKEVLITSLLDTVKYPHSIFKNLYHLRWDIEESYKKDKHRLQLENFSGKSITAIYQDFYASLLLPNITSILSYSLDDKINAITKKARFKYQLNYTSALAKVKEAIALIFTKRNIENILKKLINILISNILPVRQNRNYERIKQKKRRYLRTYLSL
jgi:hypothetical protein